MRSDGDIFCAPELATRELMEWFGWEAEAGGEIRSSVSSGSGEDIPSRSVSEVRRGQIQRKALEKCITLAKYMIVDCVTYKLCGLN